MEIVLLILRLVLAGVFGLAGIAKLADPAGSAKAFEDFGLPKVLAKPMVWLLPLFEITLAIALLFVETSWFAAIGSFGLLLAFTGGMAYQMAKGRAPDCHCFGQIHSEPVGISGVIRNLVFAAMALTVVISGPLRQGIDLSATTQEGMQYVIGIAVVALLAAAVFFLKRISEQQTEIMRRIELMELVARDGGTIEREDVSHPHEGLPIGAHFPDFELWDVDANRISSKAIKAEKKPTLFFFISPTCNPCKALIPEFQQWKEDLAGKVNFVFLSSGKAPENIEKFGDAIKPVLQNEREVADAVKAQWTPTAILMDANGRIASHPTAGDSAIRKLVERIKAEGFEAEFTHFENGQHDGHSHNKIGSTIPNFSLQDIKGEVIDSDYFKGKQTLVAFWSLTCPFCTSMMEELQAWDKTKGDDAPALVVFSEGDKEKHEEFGLNSPVILEDGYKTAGGFGMFGTPSAVLVNEDGKIISETAVGAPNIWSLVGKK